jgi:two-component system KDP operon response regulator KdpE
MRLKLLAVDDEPDILKMLQVMLELLGCEVVTFTDSRQAAAQLDSQQFDGIFVDGQMPVMSGFDLAKRIRHSDLNRDVPIVMLSGSVGSDVKGYEPGEDVTYFMRKPVDPRQLREIVTAMTRGKA